MFIKLSYSTITLSLYLSSKEDILAQIDSKTLLENDYKKVSDDYDLSVYEEKNKLIKKLMAKGHNYEQIKNLINEEGLK